MNTDDILHVFFAESRELLEQMEANLLAAETGDCDADVINSIFRAAHTIKGSAGIFGLDGIVGFTHVVENVLDEVRAGRRDLDHELVALMLECCDHMDLLVTEVAQPSGDAEGIAQHGAELMERLQSSAPAAKQATAPAIVPAATEERVYATGPGSELVASEHWHISLRPGPEVLRHGLDPLSFIRYLENYGRIVHLITLTNALPGAADMDPEANYLGYEISFESKATKAEIEGVFDFLRDDSTIRILPPHSKISEYHALIRELPEKDMKLGEILLRCGTLTEHELELALRLQHQNGGAAASPIGELLVQQSMVQPEVVQAALDKQQQVKEARAGEGSLVRVDAEKLDHHINLVGELIIASAAAGLIAKQSGSSELLEATATLARLVEEVRDSALTLRMVQIGATFNRFQRVVRDVSRELGKDIQLLISGADTELDKTVVDRIADPLTHLVRNAMDHGIESAEVRRAAGKPVKGTLRLNAYHDSGSIIIEVADDGGGLHKERILQKAMEKGLVTADQNLSEREIFNLIFEPGFSTASQISNLSGRGVGMDVVRKNIQALRGTVELESKPGQGTSCRIRLPLTLAIIDGFLVGVGDAAYVIPLDAVVECIEHNQRQNGGANEQYLNLRGEVLPFLRLREHFAVQGEQAGRENIVVVRHAGKKAGIAVDRLMGEFQTVIRPLGKVFTGIAGVGGFTVLGSGDVALILDVPGLLRQVSADGAPAFKSPSKATGRNLH